MSVRHAGRGGLFCAAVCFALACCIAHAEDLTSLSLEQLMDEPVTSVSKKETRIGQAAAAVTVITQDDLRRMGITTLPDALRLVPGMDVAQLGAGQWAITARGFNDEFANVMLVLIDGRTVYTPFSGGVAWNSQDVVIEDVDRIEVIRGPGATLWGANAVNGVINIITKSAAETQGALVSAAAGSEDRPLVSARYGAESGPGIFWRVFAQYFDRAGYSDQSGQNNPGNWEMAHGGFRADWSPAADDQVTLQAETYGGHAGQPTDVVNLVPPYVTSFAARLPDNGTDVLSRWTRAMSPDSSFTLQMYFDHAEQGVEIGTEHRNTLDFDAQDQFALGSRNDVLWGVGYRHTEIRQSDSWEPIFRPLSLSIDLYNLFVQDEITLIPSRLRVTLGSKFERNDLSGWSVEPNARLLLTPSDRQTLWAAVSRATRTPSAFELEGIENVGAYQPSVPGSLPVLVRIQPNPNLHNEELTAYELGYRFEPLNHLTLDVSMFVNQYTGIVEAAFAGLQFAATPAPPHEVSAWINANAADGNTFGAEAELHWQVTRNWNLTGSYTWLRMTFESAEDLEAESPQSQFQIRSYLDLPWNLELNSALYYVDSIFAPSAATFVHIPAYVRGDAGLIWKPTTALSVGLWGRNLFAGHHLEFASDTTSLVVPVPRSWLLKATWTF